ncbi:pilus assembly protein [Microbulbifer sp. YPW1]|uniref:pilus assembly protein n=1 Tax=Microbulbifer sp. YPW1 TaxID=2745199 RepID=UPI0015993D51|nr:PilC/PilY family type IV pilus protein [Microbulbifer sp. YPW1]QKX17358.1 pilus assembly protein PilY [Microbulbifer sp. YPW1]
MAKNVIIKKISSALVATLLCLGISHSAVSLDLAQSPLFLSNGAPPNVMFVIDDSGSMHFEITPEEYRRDTAYIFPRADGVYGNNGYNQTENGDYQVPTVDSNNAYNALTRSPQYNKSYYDPSVTYTPWVKYDGSLYPNATPSCALHNPENTGDCPSGTASVNEIARDLTVTNGNYNSNGWRSCSQGFWGNITCSSTDEEKTYWPATYFWHNGTGSAWDWNSYSKVEIKSDTATYTGHDRTARTDCIAGVCTYEQEIQNFANWYTYYRSRTLAARAGIGRAFSEQGEDMRVGFGAINKGNGDVDGVNTGTIVNGVRTFSGTNRQNFFEELYTRDVPTSGTPLRQALDDAGQYFSRTDNKGPWGADPGVDDSTAHLACRASYTILMTDGYWNGNQAGTVDARANIDGTAGSEITGPDGQSYTYSAVSPFSDSNSNTLADVAMYYWNRDLRTDLSNDVPVKDSSVDPAFWQHMVTFGVGLGVEGSINSDDAFAAIDSGDTITWPDPSSGNSDKIDDLLHASLNGRGGFFSAADPQAFASDLSEVLENIVGRTDGSASSVATNSTRLGTDTVIYQALFNSTNWSGELRALNLNSDGTVGSTKWKTDDSKFTSYAMRNIVTYNGGGVDFAWANLSTAQQDALKDGGTDAEGQARLNWVRGLGVTGLRDRESILGDIVNSSPVFAGDKKYNFHLLSEELGGLAYETYYTGQKANRREVIYVGANDGMLHAFDASTGSELFAYIPSGVYEQLADMSAADYGTSTNPHAYSMDGKLFVGDAYVNGAWKNILVGSLGAGGRGIFALDVTNPDGFDESDVLFEFTEADFPGIGNITGEPIIAPTNDGWKLIFGNGYNSENTRARLFAIDLNDPLNETQVIEVSDTGNNGLAGPALLSNGDGEVVAAYAGDLLGNMWKFDLSANNASNWDVAFGNGGAKDPFFTAVDPNGKVQPITATPTLGLNNQMDGAIMVYFGTGSYISSTDNAVGDVINSFYALADQDAEISGRSALMEKSIATQENGKRVVQDNEATSWWGNKKGWYLDLSFGGSVTGERITSKPLLIYDRLLFPTLITSSDPCSFGGSGWLMELVAVGDRYDGHSIFGEDGVEVDYAVISYSDIIRGGEKAYLPTSNIKGELDVEEGDFPIDAVGRMSWRQLR